MVFLALMPLLGVSMASAQGNEVELWVGDDEFGACWSSWYIDNFPNKDISVKVVLEPSGALDSSLRTAVMVAVALIW
jgi:hypothetical protein